MAALLEELRILHTAQRLGGPGCGAVGQRVFHVVGYRFVEQVARDVAVFHPQAVAAVGVHGRLFNGLESLFAVEPFDALHDGVRNDGNTRVTHHAVGLVAPQVPHRKAPLLVGDRQHRPDDVGHLLRVENRHQRHRGPVGVPQREGRVVDEVGRTVDFAVRAAVVAVDVAELRGGDHRVVERRIENPPGRVVLRLDADFRKLGVPGLVGRRGDGLEIPAGKLGLHVEDRILDRHGRDGHLEQQLLALLGIELDPCIAGFYSGALAGHFTGLFIDDALGRLRELRGKIDLLVLRPARRVTPSADARAVVREQETGIGRLVPAAAVLQVEDHGGSIRCWEGVAVQSHTRRGRHLGRDAVPCQRNRVVTRPGDLPRAVGIGPEARLRVIRRAAGIGHLARDGHDGDVEQVSDARSAQVRMRKADYRRITRVVARSPVPRLRDARGAHLHQSERNVRTHEDVPVAARADSRVHEAGKIVVSDRLRAGAQQQRSSGQ